MVEQLTSQLASGSSILTSPLQLRLVETNARLSCDLNKLWHSRLPNIHWSNVVKNIHYVCYVAFFFDVPVAVGIWSTPVAANRLRNGSVTLELRRLAISSVCPKNTASWMISRMIKLIRHKFPDIVKLISYQDTDVHTGTIYRASGWFQDNKSSGASWTTNSRKRNVEQTLSPKIRWAKWLCDKSFEQWSQKITEKTIDR